MSLPPLSRLILVICFLIHIQVCTNYWILSTSARYFPLAFSLLQGVMYLCYPLCGWVADVFDCHFSMIKSSVVMMFIGSIIQIVTIVIYALASYDERIMLAYLLIMVDIVIYVLGLGMFEANAIQFGLNQMMDASTEQLRSFVHWYFWCAHVGPLLVFHTSFSIYYATHDVKYCTESVQNRIVATIALIISIACVCFSLLVLLCMFCSNRFHVEKLSQNPLKIVYSVLKYAYQNKYPERRSAFTYWENDIPSRIDLGKDKYGGPFTFEQVEDVKTMFRLIMLMVCLFGFHLIGTGSSFSNFIMYSNGCPSLVPLLLLLLNPEHIPWVVISIGIPLYRVFYGKYSKFIPRLLNFVKIGLVFCLFSKCSQCFLSSLIPKHLIGNGFGQFWGQAAIQCAQCSLTATNGSCFVKPHYRCAEYNNYVIYLTIIPLFLQGLGYMIVFVSMLEFICAQAPNAMKGTLVGIWYSMLFIKYAVVSSLDVRFSLFDLIPWNIYNGIKGFLVFVSIIAFLLACSKYQYRQRNEVVSEQRIIEDLYERELLLNSSLSSSFS